MEAKENKKFYFSKDQRELLIDFSKIKIIRNNFFLTGGTALAVFYLNHRISNDLDLFTIKKNIKISDIDYILRQKYLDKRILLKSSDEFISLIINNIKVDFVIDLLSLKNKRKKYYFNEDTFITVDTIENISSNKLTALASRSEPKDFIDFYYIGKLVWGMNLNERFNFCYRNAQKKEAIFDDPATVAYQIEENLNLIKNIHPVFESIKLKFNFNDFIKFYERIIKTIYAYESAK